MTIADGPRDVLAALVDGAGEGCAGVLVTLVGIEGASSRAIGTQMAVLGDGRRVGSFSGGCIEAAVVAEALEALDAGLGRRVRYGLGSPYLDIRLPCGGGIDLLFTPRPDVAVLAGVLAELTARRAAVLVIDEQGVRADGAGFRRAYVPQGRLVAIGQGEEVAALARLAACYGLEVLALVPAGDSLVGAAAAGFAVVAMADARRLPAIAGDDWTAVVFLFHDRDWEEHLIPQALAGGGCFFGAVGSRRTHAARVLALRDAGVSDARIAALHAPVGLIPATRDPAMLALSILAQVAAAIPGGAPM